MNNGRSETRAYCPHCSALTLMDVASKDDFVYYRCRVCRRSERLPDFKRYEAR